MICCSKRELSTFVRKSSSMEGVRIRAMYNHNLLHPFSSSSLTREPLGNFGSSGQIFIFLEKAQTVAKLGLVDKSKQCTIGKGLEKAQRYPGLCTITLKALASLAKQQNSKPEQVTRWHGQQQLE